MWYCLWLWRWWPAVPARECRAETRGAENPSETSRVQCMGADFFLSDGCVWGLPPGGQGPQRRQALACEAGPGRERAGDRAQAPVALEAAGHTHRYSTPQPCCFCCCEMPCEIFCEISCATPRTLFARSAWVSKKSDRTSETAAFAQCVHIWTLNCWSACVVILWQAGAPSAARVPRSARSRGRDPTPPPSTGPGREIPIETHSRAVHGN